MAKSELGFKFPVYWVYQLPFWISPGFYSYTLEQRNDVDENIQIAGDSDVVISNM
jgi:hypothetical protein